MATQEEVIKAYKENFSLAPFVFFASGRINLIGEHIDYNNGFVMPAAIDKGIYFAIAPNTTDTINFVSVDLNEKFSININSIEKKDGWKNYLLGVLHILQKEGFVVHGFDCAFGGDLPVGAGLSSSAAVESGLIFALNKLFNFNLSRVQLAQLAQKAEHSYPNVQCGIMDMFASLNGKKNHVILLDCNTLQYTYFPLQLNEYSIVLINSKVHHSLASSEYNIRRRQCEEGLSIIKNIEPAFTSFRNIPSEKIHDYKDVLGEEIYKRCLYVTEEIERTQLAATHLQNNDLVAFGELMYQTHQGLSELYNVSCDELDFLVNEAKKHSAIIGSRLMGGGFGGCTINIIETKKAAAIIELITAAYENKFTVNAEVYKVQTSDGTFEIITN